MLRVDGLQVRYGGIVAVRDLSFALGAGECVALIGPNGAGKSSTLRAISGLAPIAAGRISLLGDALAGLRPHAIARRGIAHVPEGRQVFRTLTVRENLELGAYPGAGRAAFARTLERVHALFPILAERAGQLAGTLSGGEQQMLAIGRGLAAAPRLLMLDEPSMGLAPAVTETIFAAIAQVHKEDGLAILLVEQRVAEALELSDHGYVLETGRVVLDGPYQTLLADDRVRRSYLGLGES